MSNQSQMLVYLSGKMSGLEGYGYTNFTKRAARLRELGYDVLNPAETAGGVTHLPRETFISIDIGYVMAADAVVVMDNWQQSKGAKLEMILAHNVGKPVYTYSEEHGLGQELILDDWGIKMAWDDQRGPRPGDEETAWSPEMREIV